MTEPTIRRFTPGPTLDERLRAIVSADEGVSARRRPADHETDSVAVAAADEALVHTTFEVSGHVVDHLLGGAFGASITAVVPPLLALTHVISDGDDRRDALIAQRQHDRMRGALAVLEGRIGTDTVQLEMLRNPSFADGVRRAENLARTMTPAQLNELVGFVRRAGNEGQAAVCLGRDHGPAFDARYESDAAFAHGVDFARGLREDNPVGFTARVARFT